MKTITRLLWILPYEIMSIYLFFGLLLDIAYFYIGGLLFLLINYFFYILMSKDEKDISNFEWLILHNKFIKFDLFFFIINFIIGVSIGLIDIFNIYNFKNVGNIDTMNFSIIYFCIICFIELLLSYKISNKYGMNYANLFRESICGSKAYSELCIESLKDNKEVGLKASILSTQNMIGYISSLNRVIEDINLSNLILSNIREFDDTNNHESIIELMKEYNSDNLEKIITASSLFNSKQELVWATKINKKIFFQPYTQKYDIIGLFLLLGAIISNIDKIVSFLTNMDSNTIVPILKIKENGMLIFTFLCEFIVILPMVFLADNIINTKDIEKYLKPPKGNNVYLLI